MVDSSVAERSTVASGLPENASESKNNMHFQKRKKGGDVEKILRREKKDVVTIFTDAEDAKLVLKSKQSFQHKTELAVCSDPIANKKMAFKGMTVFESVSGQLHHSLVEGLSQHEITSVMETVNETASVQWVASNGGLLLTGTIKQLEIARNIIEEEIKLIRVRVKNQVFDVRLHSVDVALGHANNIKERELKNDKNIMLPEPTLRHDQPQITQNMARSSSKTAKQLQKPNKVQLTWPEKSSHGTFKYSQTPTNSRCLKNFRQNHSERERKKFRPSNVVPGNNGEEKRKKSKSEESGHVAYLPNMVSVKIIQGELTNHLPADIIVNPCNDHLQNSTGIGASIIDNGGLSIQIELNETLGYRKTYPAGSVIKTSAGTLPFKNIYHIVCPEWDSAMEEDSYEELHSVLLKSLNAFSRTTFKTIAYPSFSCPSLASSDDVCAQVMLNAVSAFANNRNTYSSWPINVHFVLEQPSSFTSFQKELEKLKTDKTKKAVSRDGETDAVGNIAWNDRMESRNNCNGREGIQSQEIVNKCPVCLDEIKQPKTLEKCQHTFCKTCVENAFKVKKICPLCKLSYGIVTGTQPNGKMTVTRETSSLPGFFGYGTIAITYEFKDGYQGTCHPSPGRRYTGTTRVAYLPDSREGNEVLDLLRKAFDHRLIFKIGMSFANRTSNRITWSDISHKTSKYGGQQNFGYPDPDYLMTVKEQLAAKGIYP